MRFEEWEPIYLDILKDMGYDRYCDEHAARVLSGILDDLEPGRLASLQMLRELINGADVLVCGNAPALVRELENIDPGDFCIIAADGAAGVLMQKNIVPSIIVTDLDGDVVREVQASRKGSIMVVHAHGDNIQLIRDIMPKLMNVIGSTQAAPLNNVYNFGGFTDGDRCVFLAREFGASSITLIGFDFEDTAVSPMKNRKLNWARKLIDIITDA